jgi:hypothetical protein
MPKTFYRRVRHFHIFQKNGITEFFYILLIVSFSSKSNNARKKLGVTMLLFRLYEAIGHFWENFVHVYRHGNELYVTKTNIIWK